MLGLDNNQLLIIIGIVAIIIEIILGAITGFDLLLIGLIFIIGGLAGQFMASFSGALVVIIAASFIYIFIARGLIKKRLTIETHATNADSILGKKSKVVKKISQQQAGQVKIEGELWRAISDVTIDKGEEVVIQSISGVTLTVIPKKTS